MFNLFGKDQALLIFPNEERTSGRIEPGQTIPIGGKLGFEATPFPGFDGERYLVIAADSEAGLGVWGRSSGTCRVAPASAAALHSMQRKGFPTGFVTWKPPGTRFHRGTADEGHRLTVAGGCTLDDLEIFAGADIAVLRGMGSQRLHCLCVFDGGASTGTKANA